jgi:hypothetical protein
LRDDVRITVDDLLNPETLDAVDKNVQTSVREIDSLQNAGGGPEAKQVCCLDFVFIVVLDKHKSDGTRVVDNEIDCLAETAL